MSSAHAVIDRATLARPTKRVSGTQLWRNLLFLHWRVPVDVMRAAVPRELELDLWQGQVFVGVVAFEMQAVRPWWLPTPFALDFLETNVRTYVHHRGRPGVYFFSLEAASWLAVKAAQWGWGLPYHHAEMSTPHSIGEITYSSQRRSDGAALTARYQLGAQLGPSAPHTLEHFLLERYLLFTVKKGRVHEAQVHHAPYPAQRVDTLQVRQTLTEAVRLGAHLGAPEHAHFASGVDVEVFGPWPAGTG